MRNGQASLELMLITAAFIACFAMLMPNIISIKDAGLRIVSVQNSAMVLNEINFNCEKSKILGRPVTFSVNAVGEMNLSTDCSTILLSRGKNQLTADGSELHVIPLNQSVD